uniref:VWFA domain-containing protein n=1 Tax=Chromera velia CCMP2878 TaxID=1169474 RepID=A0A0G4FGV4_9ALVE|eukprot:Cvel_3330.t1-p1 / transcript=Cvel_3330.t1 / gene=Cvel_3330 / organism=Chromera_velia_CCMP2878 / gene_product=Brain-specific angiogenesis inhibitor 1, putative / transcript_product=Brain-specific angiogenesis inhibitor 1, putative / location=Cvel_scaffold132:86931-93403(-) / protein_length=1043 / sequence_SO=supercontig / SO=protein_coding / is_pseudo=false
MVFSKRSISPLSVGRGGGHCVLPLLFFLFSLCCTLVERTEANELNHEEREGQAENSARGIQMLSNIAGVFVDEDSFDSLRQEMVALSEAQVLKEVPKDIRDLYTYASSDHAHPSTPVEVLSVLKRHQIGMIASADSLTFQCHEDLQGTRRRFDKSKKEQNQIQAHLETLISDFVQWNSRATASSNLLEKMKAESVIQKERCEASLDELDKVEGIMQKDFEVVVKALKSSTCFLNRHPGRGNHVRKLLNSRSILSLTADPEEMEEEAEAHPLVLPPDFAKQGVLQARAHTRSSELEGVIASLHEAEKSVSRRLKGPLVLSHPPHSPDQTSSSETNNHPSLNVTSSLVTHAHFPGPSSVSSTPTITFLECGRLESPGSVAFSVLDGPGDGDGGGESEEEEEEEESEGGIVGLRKPKVVSDSSRLGDEDAASISAVGGGSEIGGVDSGGGVKFSPRSCKTSKSGRVASCPQIYEALISLASEVKRDILLHRLERHRMENRCDADAERRGEQEKLWKETLAHARKEAKSAELERKLQSWRARWVASRVSLRQKKLDGLREKCEGGMKKRLREMIALQRLRNRLLLKAAEVHPKEEGGGGEGDHPERLFSNTMDCSVSKWEFTPCSKTCGPEKGKIIATRRILGEPSGIAAVSCPVLSAALECNRKRKSCPQECRVSQWAEWSVCDSECDAGMRTRTRRVTQMPKRGGEECPQLKESAPCPGRLGEEKLKMDAAEKSENLDLERRLAKCTRDCVLTEWTQWDTCGLTCGGGWQKRMRNVASPATAGGHCPKEGGNEIQNPRLEWRQCNQQQCPAGRPICETPLDLVLLLDSSGSLGREGFSQVAAAARAIVSRLDFRVVRVSLITFSQSANVMVSLTNDRHAVISNLTDATGSLWVSDGLGAATAHALDSARDMLTGQQGESEESEDEERHKVVLLVTDSLPSGTFENGFTEAFLAPQSAKRLKEEADARVMVAVLQNSGGMSPSALKRLDELSSGRRYTGDFSIWHSADSLRKAAGKVVRNMCPQVRFELTLQAAGGKKLVTGGKKE